MLPEASGSANRSQRRCYDYEQLEVSRRSRPTGAVVRTLFVGGASAWVHVDVLLPCVVFLWVDFFLEGVHAGRDR